MSRTWTCGSDSPNSRIRVAMNIVVGPSAPPMIPIEAASSSPKLNQPSAPRISAPTRAKNTPACAPAPSNKVLGLESIGEKSVAVPTPKKISNGKMSDSNPTVWNVRRIPVGSPSPPARMNSPNGRLAKSIPIEMGTKSNGSLRLATPTYNNAAAITHIATMRGSSPMASKPANI